MPLGWLEKTAGNESFEFDIDFGICLKQDRHKPFVCLAVTGRTFAPQRLHGIRNGVTSAVMSVNEDQEPVFT
jgi:hypothetical protein